MLVYQRGKNRSPNHQQFLRSQGPKVPRSCHFRGGYLQPFGGLMDDLSTEYGGFFLARFAGLNRSWLVTGKNAWHHPYAWLPALDGFVGLVVQVVQAEITGVAIEKRFHQIPWDSMRFRGFSSQIWQFLGMALLGCQGWPRRRNLVKRPRGRRGLLGRRPLVVRAPTRGSGVQRVYVVRIDLMIFDGSNTLMANVVPRDVKALS